MKSVIQKITTDVRVQVFVLGLVAAAVYASTLGYGFVWDDHGFIKWPLIRSLANIPLFFTGAFPTEHFGHYRPIKGILFALSWALFSDHPIGYHFISVLIHVSATIAVFLLTKTLILEKYMFEKSHFVAFVTALIFAVHPIHTESVAFVTAGSDILGVTFVFISLYLYLKKFRVLSTLLFALGLLTYEMALVLPILIIWYDWCFKSRQIKSYIPVVAQFAKTQSKRSVRMVIPRCIFKCEWYIPYALLLGLYGFVRYGLLHISEGKSYPENNLFLTMITMVKVFAKYVYLLIWPVDLNVAHEISAGIFTLIQGDFNREAFLAQKITDSQFIWSFLTLIILGLVAVVSYKKKRKIITFSIGWFFIGILPVSNIIPLSSLMGEQYLYLASFGFCLLIADLFYTLYQSRWLKFPSIVGLLVVCMFFSILTVRRNAVWRDDYSLWSDTVAKTPKSALANYNLALAYERKGDAENALKHFHVASENNGNNLARFPLILGELYSKKGEFEKAKTYYQKAIDYAGSEFEKYYIQARLYQIAGSEARAIEAYKRAILANPTILGPHINLGIMYAQQKKWEKAIEIFKKAYAIDPDNEQVKSHLERLDDVK